MNEWRRIENVLCVECPDCLFIFAADHTDQTTGGHSCPNCSEARGIAEGRLPHAVIEGLSVSAR